MCGVYKFYGIILRCPLENGFAFKAKLLGVQLAWSERSCSESGGFVHCCLCSVYVVGKGPHHHGNYCVMLINIMRVGVCSALGAPAPTLETFACSQ